MVIVALARLSTGGKPPSRIVNAAGGVAEALFDIASVLNQAETADLSLIYGRLAVELKPDFPLAQLLVGDVLETQRRAADALAIDPGIGARSPYAWAARLRAASNLDTLGRSDAAIAQVRATGAEPP